MKSTFILFFIWLSTLSGPIYSIETQPTADEALSKFLAHVNERLAKLYNKEVLANWQNEIQGPNNLIALLQSELATEEIMKFLTKISSKVAKFKRLTIKDDRLRRQLQQIPKLGYESLGKNDQELMYAVTTNMSDIYRNTQLCSYLDRHNCNLNLIPDVQKILHESDSIEEIEYYWLEWRRKTGTAAKGDFLKFVELYRRTAQLNGFSKPSDFWFKDLEEDSAGASKLIDGFMHELQPLFRQFHAYVRGKLRKMYGTDLIPRGKPYPQHLAEIFIGNAFQAQASNTKWLLNLPYSNVSQLNVTASLWQRELNNPQRIFWNVADYFRSLGMPQIEVNFWLESARSKSNAFREKQQEMYITCWHKAWKYYGMSQVNFSYCPNVDEDRFLNMFEALSDVYYYRAYQMRQPTLFQEEPFPNFSDALGKFFSLAASSPRFLAKFKLTDSDVATSYEMRINRLYMQGLRTIFLLPVFHILDRYRVDILDGKININNNCAYWQLTEAYTGAEPPVMRTNLDFDAPAKLLMEVDDQYTSQIMSIVLEYQLYKYFCERTGQYKPGDDNLPLDLCDISNQHKIGPIILNAMSLGSSKSYKEILQLLTNEKELKINGLLEYFQPLYNWLLRENQNENNEIGWSTSKRCTA